ncbi:MAG TPA: response regulator [Chthoniobacterales bacterium]|nr:response regulator [Chthoniobacterales bacterium]
MKSRRPLRIFILEDQADTRTVLRMHVEKLGHTAFTAGSLSEATLEMRKTDFDILLSDIGLNDGLGWDFLQSLHFTKPVYAIAMSGVGSPEDQARSRLAGFRHHLTKPINFERLNEILEEGAAHLKAQERSKAINE